MHTKHTLLDAITPHGCHRAPMGFFMRLGYAASSVARCYRTGATGAREEASNIMIRSGRRDGKVGCGGCLLVLVGGFVALVIIIAQNRPQGVPDPSGGGRLPGRAQAPAPSRPAERSLAVGDAVILDVPGATRVYLATTDESWNDLLDAENAKSVELMSRLIERGRAIVVANGTRGVIVKNAVLSRLVRLTDGPSRGQEGWIQAEFVKPAE